MLAGHIGDQQRRQPLRKLGKFDGGGGVGAGVEHIDRVPAAGIGDQRRNRCRVGAIGDGKADGPVASSPSARARLAVMTRCVRPGAQSCRNAASRSSVMPSTGRAAIGLRADVDETGRPERNSARPRSTAI